MIAFSRNGMWDEIGEKDRKQEKGGRIAQLVVVVVVGFIHCDFKQGYFYIDYSIETVYWMHVKKSQEWRLQVHGVR